MGFLMQTLESEQEMLAKAGRDIAQFTSGDILEVRMLVPEAGRTEYMFKGLCIARYNKGIRSAFKLYNVFPESGGVVQHIPLYMPDLVSVKVVGKVHKRRSKLYYIRDEAWAHGPGQPGLMTSAQGHAYQAEPLKIAAAGSEVEAKSRSKKPRKAVKKK